MGKNPTETTKAFQHIQEKTNDWTELKENPTTEAI